MTYPCHESYGRVPRYALKVDFDTSSFVQKEDPSGELPSLNPDSTLYVLGNLKNIKPIHGSKTPELWIAYHELQDGRLKRSAQFDFFVPKPQDPAEIVLSWTQKHPVVAAVEHEDAGGYTVLHTNPSAPSADQPSLEFEDDVRMHRFPVTIPLNFEVLRPAGGIHIIVDGRQDPDSDTVNLNARVNVSERAAPVDFYDLAYEEAGPVQKALGLARTVALVTRQVLSDVVSGNI